MRVRGAALDEGFVTVLGARVRSAADAPRGWDAWGGTGLHRDGAWMQTPTLDFRARDGLGAVLVADVLGVAVSPGEATLDVELCVDGEVVRRRVTVTVHDAAHPARWRRAACDADERARCGWLRGLVTRARREGGRRFARTASGALLEGDRADGWALRAEAAGRSTAWWAHDDDEARWVLRAESRPDVLRVSVACVAAEAEAWRELGGDAAWSSASSPWAE